MCSGYDALWFFVCDCVVCVHVPLYVFKGVYTYICHGVCTFDILDTCLYLYIYIRQFAEQASREKDVAKKYSIEAWVNTISRMCHITLYAWMLYVRMSRLWTSNVTYHGAWVIYERAATACLSVGCLPAPACTYNGIHVPQVWASDTPDPRDYRQEHMCSCHHYGPPEGNVAPHPCLFCVPKLAGRKGTYDLNCDNRTVHQHMHDRGQDKPGRLSQNMCMYGASLSLLQERKRKVCMILTDPTRCTLIDLSKFKVPNVNVEQSTVQTPTLLLFRRQLVCPFPVRSPSLDSHHSPPLPSSAAAFAKVGTWGGHIVVAHGHLHAFDPSYFSGRIRIRPFFFKGEPLEKEIHKILGSKREDRFSDPFWKMVQKNIRFVFRTCFINVIYVRARGHCESSHRSARR